MVKDVKSLDLTTDFDLIYFYKNVYEYSEHIHLLSTVRAGDLTTGMICYGFVEAAVLEELGLGAVDNEMRYLLEGMGESRNKIEGSINDNSSVSNLDNISVSNLDINSDNTINDQVNITDNQVNTTNDNVNITDNQVNNQANITDNQANITDNQANITDNQVNITDNQVNNQANTKNNQINTKNNQTNITDNIPLAIPFINNNSVQSNLFLNNLPVLLSPFLRLFDKQIVDLVFFVYRKTGTNHFETLFKEHEGSKDLLIELHLLVARGAKCRSFDFSDIKEMLESERNDRVNITGDQNKDIVAVVDKGVMPDTRGTTDDVTGFFTGSGDSIKKEEVDFFEDVSDDSANEDTPNIEIGCFEDNNLEKIRPFILSKNSTPMAHLEQAKQLLLSMGIKDQSFYVESVSTFLSIRFDRTLFLSYIRTPHNHQFYRTLSKFKEPPFFFYKDLDIRYLLFENNANGRMRRRGVMGKLDLRDNDVFMDRTTEYNSSNTYKHTIVCNAYTLKYFISYSTVVFSDYLSAAESYLVIAKYLSFFVNKYKHLSLFRVLNELFDNRIAKVYDEVCEYILENIKLYMEVFYNDKEMKVGGNEEEGVILDEELIKEWKYGESIDKECVTIKSEDTDINIDENTDKYIIPVKSIALDATASNMKIPSFDSSTDDDIVYYFNHPNVLKPIDLKLATVYLDTFYKNYDRKSLIYSFLLESSKSTNRKIFILNNLEILEYLDEALKKPILDNICNITNTKWRYRAVLIQKRKELVKMGVSDDWFENTFAKDRVYFIRKMVKE
ncbi:hypothetical protein PAEPH01_1327 [Pancytospora epiphaga]|nr:hypothetical protein PAEPH01_1327 [Pancytospora epiphaga]